MGPSGLAAAPAAPVSETEKPSRPQDITNTPNNSQEPGDLLHTDLGCVS